METLPSSMGDIFCTHSITPPLTKEGRRRCDHVVVPRELIGSEAGDIELPVIYRKMLNQILNMVTTKELWDGATLDALKESRKFVLEDLCIDLNGFKGGKGQLIRLPHIQRADGNYKVPVTYDEIMRVS